MKKLRLRLKRDKLRRIERRLQYKLIELERSRAAVNYLDRNPMTYPYDVRGVHARYARIHGRTLRMTLKIKFLYEDIEELELG